MQASEAVAAALGFVLVIARPKAIPAKMKIEASIAVLMNLIILLFPSYMIAIPSGGVSLFLLL